jgi:hypothetical protein
MGIPPAASAVLAREADPLPAPPPPPPPPPIAEPGPTTSEWKLTLAAVGQTGVALLVVLLGNHAQFLTSTDVTAIGAFAGAVDTLAVAYVLSRGVRKIGTSG